MVVVVVVVTVVAGRRKGDEVCGLMWRGGGTGRDWMLSAEPRPDSTATCVGFAKMYERSAVYRTQLREFLGYSPVGRCDCCGLRTPTPLRYPHVGTPAQDYIAVPVGALIVRVGALVD